MQGDSRHRGGSAEPGSHLVVGILQFDLRLLIGEWIQTEVGAGFLAVLGSVLQ
jgi:hypothetical protein